MFDTVTDASTDGIKKRNAKGESQLHVASREGNLSLVKVLIESGADVNLKDNAGWVLLIVCVFNLNLPKYYFFLCPQF